MRQRIANIFRKRSRDDGFIVVAVLWILAALATLAMIFSMYVINTATAFAVHDERLQAEGLARAAIELSVYQVALTPQKPPSRGTFVFRIGNAQVNAEFSSETARIDLNAAQKELLAGLFASLGAQRGQADYYADRIVGWRTPQAQADPNSRNNEAGLYRAAGLAYGPRGAPFPHTGELALVLGIPELMVERALPYLTVYSGQSQINVLNAAPQVIAALPGMDPRLLNAVLVQREAGQQNAAGLVAMLGPAATFANTQASKTLRVTARIAFDSGQRMTTEVVVFLLDGNTEPYRVLTWRDDMDGTPVSGAARR